jgi:plasmid stabilization system protein ParE
MVSDLHAISEYIELDRNLETANRVARDLRRNRKLADLALSAVWKIRASLWSHGCLKLSSIILEARILVLNILHGAQRWS